MSDSIRKRILQALVTLFEGVVVGPDYPFAFNFVTRLPVASLKVGQRAVLGIYAGEDPKTPTAGIAMTCLMTITFEIWVHRDVGENMPDLLEDALALVERKLMEDQRLGGLAMDINVQRLDTDIDGPFDNQSAGAITATIQYRHHRDDPALEVGQ